MDTLLQESTPVGWVPHVLKDFNAFLLDHASCERKAAALAMSLVVKYPDRQALIKPMVSLAREELLHFQQVFRLVRARKLILPLKDQKDEYINLIMETLRHGREERFLDRLIMSGLVEARGEERFRILSEHLEDPLLKQFYKELSIREAGHCQIFLRIAQRYFAEEIVQECIFRLSEIESRAMLKTPFGPKLH